MAKIAIALGCPATSWETDGGKVNIFDMEDKHLWPFFRMLKNTLKSRHRQTTFGPDRIR